MRILFLAPHPFYQERGTPIAVGMLLEVLGADGHHVDVITYHEGCDRSYKNVRIHRIRPWGTVKDIRPGFSLKKLYCDCFMAVKAFRMLRQRKYDLIHAVEESAFMALLFKGVNRIPFVYDMDSSLSIQMIDHFKGLSILSKPMSWLESLPIKHAAAVAPMCEDLATRAKKYRKRGVIVVKDVSLMNTDSGEHNGVDDLRAKFKLQHEKIVMYIGNLESYQGIDLLLDSFYLLRQAVDEVCLIVIGGVSRDIETYRERAESLGLRDSVHFVGPRPVEHIGLYMKQADILVSPRVKGTNTPMKIYSYLHSGTAVVATDLPTHTQVLTSEIACLAAPEAKPFAAALETMLRDAGMRARIGETAKRYAEQEHSYERFVENVHELYRSLAAV
jgi:glycosyltransferase involved in cell wall biosynthesis